MINRLAKTAFPTVSTTLPEFNISVVHFRIILIFFFNFLLKCVKIHGF